MLWWWSCEAGGGWKGGLGVVVRLGDGFTELPLTMGKVTFVAECTAFCSVVFVADFGFSSGVLGGGGGG